MIQTALTFDDLLLVPKFSSITSRSEVDLSQQLDKDITLCLPVVSSPMDTVTEVDMAVAMSKAGGLGIIHRYNSIEQQAKLVEQAKENGAKFVGAAVGSTGDFYERASELVKWGVDVVCVDVAHGHHQNVRDAIQKIKNHPSHYKFHLMAGNVATGKGFQDLSDWGADSIRVGIGGGCFVPGTLVNTENGLKKIEDIKVGDRVFSHTGKLQPVINTLTFDRDEEIVSVNGIDCTKNHEFYIVESIDSLHTTIDNLHLYAKWIHAENLVKGKHLLVHFDVSRLKHELKQITSIETKHYKGVVHDLTVQEDHSYNVRGTIVHNSICSTRLNTGFGVPNLSAIFDCAQSQAYKTGKSKLIVDGGIKNSGDMVKAFAAGAHFVMCGSLLAGTDESPGETFVDSDGVKMKNYRGMASREAQTDWRGKSSAPEGISTFIKHKGSVVPILQDIHGNIQSGFSYAGARNFSEFAGNVQFIQQTHAGLGESFTHILNRK